VGQVVNPMPLVFSHLKYVDNVGRQLVSGQNVWACYFSATPK